MTNNRLDTIKILAEARTELVVTFNHLVTSCRLLGLSIDTGGFDSLPKQNTILSARIESHLITKKVELAKDSTCPKTPR